MVDLGELLESSGAVLKGHFVLTSGRHSDTYFEKFRVLERPDVLTALCKELAAFFEGDRPDFVAGPTTGGIIIAFDVARQMGIPAIYVESENGKKTLRRGKTIPRDARVLVVDDVLTTGTSIREVLEVIAEHGAVPCGVGVLIDRTEQPIDFGVPLHAAHRVTAQSFPPDGVPDWLQAIPTQKPGSRPTA